MNVIKSKSNEKIKFIRELASSSETRRESGAFICEGSSTLEEAVKAGAEITAVFWKASNVSEVNGLNCEQQYLLDDELFNYASFLKNSSGPLFTVNIPKRSGFAVNKAIILESVQDPGNVGTIVRAADAFGIDCVILTGACADLYNPKTVRATMGAVFRENVNSLELNEIPAFLKANSLKLYGAALHKESYDIRELELNRAAVAIGNEGRGLSDAFLDICDGTTIIPINSCSESLNAAMAATVVMWEMVRQTEDTHE